MGERGLLGPADVSDAALAAMVRDRLGVADVDVLSCDVSVADYDLEALTTAGRYWVRGTARHAGGDSPYAFFVKVVQSWTRTAQFQQVPEPMREVAAAGLPWRTEPLVYRSDLRDRLPAGLTMPRAYAVIDIDELSAGLWLEPVQVDPAPWSLSRFERAAYLLGRLAASPTVRPVAAVAHRGVVRSYVHGRVEHQILPTLRSDDLWRHPLVAAGFGPELRDRLLAAADSLPALTAELDDAPLGIAHGDASPHNLLTSRGADEDLVLIDFGFFSEAPLGFDLSQLLLGQVQVGTRPAAELPALEEACLPAYVRGLRDEGCDVSLGVVRRNHALLMLVFSGLSAVPLEVLFGLPAPGSAAVVRERALAATFMLDLLESTSAGRGSLRV
jgi:hypothetical protein